MIFPKHLLRNDNGHAAFFDELPKWLNRERRREIASSLRRGGGFHVDSHAPEQVFLAWYKRQDLRYQSFWRAVQRYDFEGEQAADRVLSLDYFLLGRSVPHFLDAAVDRESIERAYPGFSELEAQVKEDYPDITRIERAMAGWLRVQEQLEQWESLTLGERELVANVVFALCGVSNSRWFLDEAVRRRDGLTDLFEWEGIQGPTSRTTNSSRDVIQEWRSVWTELKTLGDVAVSQAPLTVHLDRLTDLTSKLESLRALIDDRAALTGSLDRAIGRLHRSLSESIAAHQWFLLTAEVVKQLVARWRLAQQENIDSLAVVFEDITRANHDVEPILQTASDTFEVLSTLERKLKQLAAEVELTRAPAERRLLLERRNRADEEQLAALEGLQLIESQVIIAASPFRRPHDLTRDYAAELTARGGLEATFRNDGERPADSATISENVADPGREPIEGVPGFDNGARTPQRQNQKVANVARDAAEDTHAEVIASNRVSQLNAHGADESVNNEAVASEQSGGESPVATTLSGEESARLAEQDAADSRCLPIWTAFTCGKLAVAYQIARALHASEPNLRVPHLPLLQAVALANYVQSPNGRVARELEELYSRFNPSWFSEGPTDWSQGLNLLLVSATLNPSLIAPGSGASAVLRYRHLAGNLDSVYELCELVIEYGERLQGQSLNPSAFRGQQSIDAWRRELDLLRAELSDWRGHAPRMTMKFAPATAVWQWWQRPEGVLGRVLDVALTEDLSAIGNVRKTLKELQHAHDFKEAVTRTDRQDLNRRRGDDIHAGALMQLRERTAEALSFMERWLELMETRPSQSDYLARQLGELRQRADILRPSLERELTYVVSSTTAEVSIVLGGVECVRRTVIALHELLGGGQQVREPELSPEVLVGSPLLLAPELDVDVQLNTVLKGGDVLPHLLKLIDAPEDWMAAFNKRLQRGDCDGAKSIMQLPGALMEADAAKAAEAYRTELEHHREGLRAILRQSRDRLEAALAYGYVDEHERAELDAILVEVEMAFESITRFQDARARVKEVVGRIETARATKLALVEAAYKQLKLPPSSSANTRLERIIQQGDVLTANEYLARLSAGESLPGAEDAGRDVFNEFFPGKAQVINAFLEAPGGGLGSVVNGIKRGDEIAGLAFAGKGADKSVWEMIEAWQRLKRTERIDEPSLVAVLAGIGFTNPRILQPSGVKAECEIQVERFADRATCPVPQYGSQAGGHYRIVCIFKRLTDEDLVRLISETSGARPALVLYFGRLNESRRRELAQVSREKRRTFLVLDEILLLFLAAESKSRLATFFSCSLPFTFVEPYITTSGLVPPEMFYGRVDELNAVRDMTGRCFIYGGRQLGKTALLREAERSFHSPKEHRVARWIDLKAEGIGMSREPSDVWSIVQRELKDVGVLVKDAPPRKINIEGIADEVRKWLGVHPARRILLLLDEADRFLEQDSRLQYPETSRLKNLMDVTSRRFKVVFAGLHNVLRTTEQANHPLAHLGDPIEIGPLLKAGEWRYARDLIEHPLAAAGYQFDPDDLMVRILAQTNYYPSLIQLYCVQLLRQLHKPYGRRLDYKNGPRYPITEAVVDETYRSKELRDAIRSRFHLTLQLDPRYEIITYVIAYGIDQGRISFEEGAESKTIREHCLSWWTEGFRGTSEHEFRVLLDEMVALGVLRHASERNYTLRNPNVLLLMGTREDIEAALLKEREQPQEFEPNLYRAQLPGDSHAPLRSPLTFGQEHSLLRKENGVTVVTGSEAAGIATLEEFLKARVGSEFLRFARAPLSFDAFIRRLDMLERRPEGGTTLHVVSQEVEWDAEWVRLAIGRIERLRAPDRHARMIFVAAPERLRAVLPQIQPLIEGLSVELLALRPWDDNFLRQWLEDMGITGADVESRRRLAQATGLWPSLVIRAVGGSASPDIARLCQTAESWLSDEQSKSSVLEQLGIRSDEERRTLQVIAEFKELSDSEISEYREFFDTNPDIVLRHLRWAETLQLAERVAAHTWRVSPFVERLLSHGQ